ncbi:GNAT family N-acetyltransferase [Dickeya zeae]|uniref:GNAT family N-acetyltransferase n=1 Tax=Dickeya zeae TaxID=204042 RepID=A0AAE6Z1X1_9GAMM|nr:GNAT family N-acetyltransferase [Dickeya zeae]QIZ52427.1 GNAT family N-acetyltransferase [Dickeya zeae]
MKINIRSYNPNSDLEEWNKFCAGSYQATFLHSRRYLSYHEDRFIDRSLVIEDEEGKWLGIFPAAIQPNDTQCISSHPGITYGGVIQQGALRGELMVDALNMVCQHYKEQGYKKLIYKVTPWIYHSTPAQDDLYALFRVGATCFRRDLSSTIDLEYRRSLSSRRKRSLKKAVSNGIVVVSGIEYLPKLWDVLIDNLNRKHGVNPVHTVQEILLLIDRFPENIECVVALNGEEVVAGTLLFKTIQVAHAQYIASSELGYELSALDAVFEHCITRSKDDGKRWFDFGISTENGGLVLNKGLYQFKSEFGGGGIVHEFFQLSLVD